MTSTFCASLHAMMGKNGGKYLGDDDSSCGPWVSVDVQLPGRPVYGPTKVASSGPEASDPCDWSETLERALLDGRPEEALRILEAFARHAGLESVLPELMVATIRRLEQLWGSEDVAEAVLLRAFGMTRQLIEIWKFRNPNRTPAHRKRVGAARVLVCVAPGDLHSFGAQIMADELTIRGWQVDVELSADAETLTAIARREPYAAILMSLGQDASLAGLGNLVRKIRQVSPNPDVLFVLGGSGLEQPFAQYHFLTVDLIAGSAAQGADFLAARLSSRLADART